uniref:NADH-ubiquinone oxidoreductase chain 2 n=1 Tax=Ludioschema sulcicolle TaxID=2803645 RepID=A0A7T8V5U2_9COLE|nr:NADH dehydrogenase subunit 2 [Ludioschema sulcicolle]QQQ88053.1 NADH dehydrogenase subunit 2 [Ludioschema sulcicolle]
MVKTYKLLFISTIMMSTLISISAYSWLGMWLGLEINLLSIIPLMHNHKNMMSAESAIKYFVVQSIASTIILLSVILLMNKTSITTNVNMQSTFLMMMNSSLLTKMGMAPFHFWFPEVMEGLDWMNCLLILTWQKIAPMVLLMYNMKFMTFMFTVIIASMIISGVMGVNQVSLRKIMAYSSINHMGWMISTMLIMETIWMYYFVIYTVMSINVVMILKTFKIFYLNQLFQSMNSSMMTKMFFILNFLSLSGIPPFLGFLPKWLTVQALVQNSMILLPTLMIILTLITIFMYMRITLSSLLMNINETNWNQMNIKFSLNKFYLALMNFFTITSLLVVTLTFNIL